ncbi:class I SAM-dependent methyltransferase [Streptomyces sp. NPDC087270]|uniref:class I SAM-dependent methyltransferase n=1 Tax=Streptomyces sp. NPDC087270 TaxID=3365774 RepID=UPI0038304ABA
MTGISYDRATAEQYRLAREVPRAGLSAWRAAIEAAVEATAERTPGLTPGMTVLDVGAGTGGFAAALHDWFGVHVVAVEPAEAMRALIPRAPATDGRPGIEALAGRADALPVPDGGADAAWLGSVLHHIPDLPAAARELRRALKPGAPVLIRNLFPGRADRDLRVRFFPETVAEIDGYRTVDGVCADFAAAGFVRRRLVAVPQESAPSLGHYARLLRRDTDSKLRALSDEDFERGMARLRAADPAAPATSWMDLLVLA